MRVKWTAELDQVLLLKILKKANLKSADFEAIVAEWPADKGPAPTPRAISEHISKMAKTGTASGAADVNNNSAKAIRTPVSKPSTPRKTTNCGTPSKASKRKREMTPAQDDEEESEDQWKGEDDTEDEMPAKKARLTIKKKKAAWASAAGVFGSSTKDKAKVVAIDGDGDEDGEGNGHFADGVEEPEDGI